jgi:hypothetical protein
MKKAMLQVVLAGLWITFSEFLRNQILFQHYWTDHFNTLGLTFATLPLNGVMWLLWSFILAFLLVRMSLRMSFWEVFGLGWLAAFAMMWLVCYNLQVLPLGLLLFAVPLSIVEILVAQIIIKVLNKNT